MSKPLVVKNKNDNANIEYYITDFEKENRIYLDRISQINENAFFNAKIKDSVEVFMNENLCISTHAFENSSFCDFICVNGQERFSENNKENYSHEKIEVQYEAFKNCENLCSAVFPSAKNISIEKEAFRNCPNLRTVVLLCENENSVYIAPDAFDENEKLTFVCIKGSDIERYAREHNFRIVSINE